MEIDRRLDIIADCLQYAFDGKIGENIRRNENMKYITELYPYKQGMFLLYTIQDSRALIFEERKLLVFITSNGYVEILGECDLRNSQSIDTCVTEEFLDARYTYANLYAGTKSLFFRKKHIKKMNEKIEYCKELARTAIQAIKIKQQNEE